jgi:hypothetical protein
MQSFTIPPKWAAFGLYPNANVDKVVAGFSILVLADPLHPSECPGQGLQNLLA